MLMVKKKDKLKLLILYNYTVYITGLFFKGRQPCFLCFSLSSGVVKKRTKNQENSIKAIA